MTILVTGCAGFIGMHVPAPAGAGRAVVGLDNLNAYYDVRLKEARLRELDPFERSVSRSSISRTCGARAPVPGPFARRVVHLAAQAGVRYSLQDPQAYIGSNLVGFVNLLEGCATTASSTWCTRAARACTAATSRRRSASTTVDHPVSLYAATKSANELMAHIYSHLFGLPTTGLRFFTVYGPWGRPDMAWRCSRGRSCAGEPIKVFNHGRCSATSPTSTTSSRGSSGPRPDPAEGRPPIPMLPRDLRQRGALSHLQHRQQPAGRAPRIHPPDRERDGPESHARSSTDATRRRSGDGGGYPVPGSCGRVPPTDSSRRGDPAVRGVASSLLRRIDGRG